MQVKQLGRVEIKNADRGEVSAVFATFNTLDSDDDVTLPGAFEEGAERPISAYGHASWQGALPVGIAKIRQTDSEAILDGHFFMDIPEARSTFLTVKRLHERGLGQWCADEETEILTSRGWLRFDELTTADRAYTLDLATQTARFEDVLAVNIFPRRQRAMRLIETGGFSSLTTSEHRWPVRFPDGHTGWRTTDTLATSNGIFRTAPRLDAPTEPKYTDAFVELVAWYWTEGNRDGKRVTISQSSRAHPQHVAAIRAALSIAFPGQSNEYTNGDGVTRFRMTTVASSTLLAVVDDKKAPYSEFLLSLTASQIRLFVERCMDGDGHTSAIGTRLWYQVDAYAVGVFEMACALAGIPTASRQPKNYGNRFGRVPHAVSLLRNPVATPLSAISVKRYNTKPRRVGHVDQWVPYEGHVWCPTTPSGTWLARRRGSVYFTGNSYGYDPIEWHVGEWEGRKARFLVKQEVHEFSPVLVGAGLTRTLSAKGLLLGMTRAEAIRELTAEYKSAIRPHDSGTTAGDWDAAAAVGGIPVDATVSDLRSMFAWAEAGADPEAKSSYKFSHHTKAGGPANIRACVAGIAVLNGARGGAGIPGADRTGVYAHLAAHLRAAGREPQELRSTGSNETKTLSEELAGFLAESDAVIESVARLVARRHGQGNKLTGVKTETLDWIYGNIDRLRALLNPQDDLAREYARFVATLRGEQS